MKLDLRNILERIDFIKGNIIAEEYRHAFNQVIELRQIIDEALEIELVEMNCPRRSKNK